MKNGLRSWSSKVIMDIGEAAYVRKCDPRVRGAVRILTESELAPRLAAEA